MPRWTTLLFGASFIGFLGAVVWKAGPAAQSSESQLAASQAEPRSDAGRADAEADEKVSAMLAAVGDSSPGTAPLASGALVLPDEAPKVVSFGVILVAYRGAQGAPKDAPAKADALVKAKALLQDARANFDEAVKKGDAGSVADAGRMPRGVLEPVLEYALFTLQKDAIYDEPIDTPRGFWIVRRTR